MQLTEIENSLPNGFHDALVESITADYARKRIAIDLRLCVGDPDGKNKQEREGYRRGELKLLDFIYLVIDPPDLSYKYAAAKDLWIDAGEAKPNSIPPNPSPRAPLPDGAFAYWFFVRDWNSFIHVAAMEAKFQWSGE